MKRSEMIKSLGEAERKWDVIIIGGGATGLGVAVDTASLQRIAAVEYML